MKHSSEPPDTVLAEWARRVAADFDARRPEQALARLGVVLHVRAEALRGARQCVFGAWDPAQRRIELFDCNAARSDEDLVLTLGHELWHMMTETRRRITCHGAAAEAGTAEATARRFADTWRRQLGPARVRQCAAALRSRAAAAPGSTR